MSSVNTPFGGGKKGSGGTRPMAGNPLKTTTTNLGATNSKSRVRPNSKNMMPSKAATRNTNRGGA